MKNLAELRKKTGKTQKEIAEGIGVERSSVAKWETGEASPRTDKLPMLAQVLGCEISELF